MEFTNKQRMLLYRNLIFAFTFENKMIDSYRRGKVPAFYHCGRGHEAIGETVRLRLKTTLSDQLQIIGIVIIHYQKNTR